MMKNNLGNGRVRGEGKYEISPLPASRVRVNKQTRAFSRKAQQIMEINTRRFPSQRVVSTLITLFLPGRYD